MAVLTGLRLRRQKATRPSVHAGTAENSLRFSAGFREEILLYILAAAVGLLTGAAAVLFDKMVLAVDGFFYGTGRWQGLYRGHPILLFLLPMAGFFVVGLIARFNSREVVGHGVPEVMDAIVRRDCRIKFHVALARMLTCALTVGSGGAIGMKGPIIQIGAAIASSTGTLFRLMRHHMPVLLGCGAAGGMAAIFNAPIAGVLFAIEVLLKDINYRTLSPILIASVLSSMTASMLLGKKETIFPLSDLAAYSFHGIELGNYILLGLLCAGTAIVFTHTLYAVVGFFERLRVSEIVRPVIGAAGLGLVGLLTIWLVRPSMRGEPIVFGNGYSFIGLCIGTRSAQGVSGFELGIGMLFVLIAAKIVATSLTLGSGGSGGIFVPSLFMGASLGYGFGLLLQRTELFAQVSPATYSLVGMASVAAATTHAPMASIVILFEMTHNYTIILPVMFSCTLSLLFSKIVCRESFADACVHRMGIRFGVYARTALLRRFIVRDIMKPGAIVVPGSMPLQEIIQKTADEEVSDLVVVDKQGRYRGLLCEKDLRNTLMHPEAIPLMVGDELARREAPVVSPEDTLDKILELFSHLDVNSLAVADDENKTHFVGMVLRSEVLRRYMDLLQEVA